MEHRWGQRQEVNQPVHIYTQGGLVGPGYVRNLSVSGAFIVTDLPVALFSCVRIQFRGRRDRRTRAAGFAGEVIRRDVDGFGIEWREFAGDQIVALTRPEHIGPLPERTLSRQPRR
jgi:PilZ domain